MLSSYSCTFKFFPLSVLHFLYFKIMASLGLVRWRRFRYLLIRVRYCIPTLKDTTYVFLNHPMNVNSVKTETFGTAINIKCEYEKVPVKLQESDADECNAIKVKILESKSKEKALVFQPENDFAELLFSFLTLPLGCALSLLGERYSTFTQGCIHYLHNSINDLKDSKEEILSPLTKDMLLNPKLPPYSGCSFQILKVNEVQSKASPLLSCETCFDEMKSECKHGMHKVRLTEINPKLTETSSEYGGGFARTSARFMMSIDMMVKPISTASTIQLLNDLGLSSLEDLRAREITIRETEALDLLMACLTSDAIPTERFLS